jgi:hypothetical protein
MRPDAKSRPVDAGATLPQEYRQTADGGQYGLEDP